MGLQEEHDAYVKSLQIGKEEERKKYPWLFKGSDKDVTSETIREEAERPIHKILELGAYLTKTSAAYHMNRNLEGIRQRYQKFPFRGGDAPLVDVKATKPDYEGIVNDIIINKAPKPLPGTNPVIQPKLQDTFTAEELGFIPPTTFMTTTGGDGIAKDKRGNPISPAEKVKANILSGVLPEPTLEQLEMAIRGGGAQNKAGWIYDRNRVSGFPTNLRDRLVAEYGGTKELAEKFRKEQLANKKQMDDEIIPELNSQFRLGFLIMFSTAKEIGGDNLPQFTTDMTWEDNVFDMYMRFLASPSGSAVYDLGHVQAAKNIDLYSEPGKPTTADFASNLEPEMKRSIKDFIMQEAKGGGLVREGEKRKINNWQRDLKALRVVEPGNIKRSNTHDLPRLLNLLSNVNPNVELEYIRWLSKHGHDPKGGTEFDKALTDIIDPMEQEALLTYVRKYIRNRQRSIKNKSGANQLKLYPRWLRTAIDDYLNTKDRKSLAQKDVEKEVTKKGEQVLKEDIEVKEVLKQDDIHGETPSEEQLSIMIDKWLEGIRPEDEIE